MKKEYDFSKAERGKFYISPKLKGDKRVRDIKIRYVFKHKVFDGFSYYRFSLEEIENGALTKILSSGMIESGYELIARDLCVGEKDINKKDIYENDTVLTDEGGWKAPVVWKLGGFFLLVDKPLKEGGGFCTEPNWGKCEIVGTEHEKEKK